MSLAEWGVKALASGGYLSYLPVRLFRKKLYTGAGLIGSLWGVLLLKGLPLDMGRQVAVWTGVFAMSVVISDAAEELLGQKDDPRIVIDEVIGYWTAVLFLPRSMGVLLVAFVLFRFLDVYKPGWIRRAADLPGGWGVIMDDVLAGAATNLVLHAVRFIRPF